MTDSDHIVNGLYYGHWIKQKSRSTGLEYYTSPSSSSSSSHPITTSSTSSSSHSTSTTGNSNSIRSIWYDPRLPLGWGWVQASPNNNQDKLYINLWNPTIQQATLPTTPAVGVDLHPQQQQDPVREEEVDKPLLKRSRKDIDSINTDSSVPSSLTVSTVSLPSVNSSTMLSSSSSSSVTSVVKDNVVYLAWEWIQPGNVVSVPLYLSVNQQGNLFLSSTPEFFHVTIILGSSSSSFPVVQCRTLNQKGILTFSSDKTTINVRKDESRNGIDNKHDNNNTTTIKLTPNTLFEIHSLLPLKTNPGSSSVSSYGFYNSLYQRWMSIIHQRSTQSTPLSTTTITPSVSSVMTSAIFTVQQSDQDAQVAWFRPLFQDNIKDTIVPILSSASSLPNAIVDSSSTTSASTVSFSSLLSLFRIPQFQDYEIAGKGKRSTVYRGHIRPLTNVNETTIHSNYTMESKESLLITCKIQPYDERVAREVQILDDLYYQSQCSPSQIFDKTMLSSLMTTVGIYRDYSSSINIMMNPQAVPGVQPSNSNNNNTVLLPNSMGTSYIFMPDYGKPLDSYTPLSWLTSLRIWLRILDCLILLHGYNYVHMDIHPGNILIQEKVSTVSHPNNRTVDPGTAILTDYGSAQSLVPVTLPSTVSSSSLSSSISSMLQYTGPCRGGRWDTMPLEQFGPGNIVYYPSSDIFCSATTFLYCITNKYIYGPDDGKKLNLRACKEHPLRKTENLRRFLTKWKDNTLMNPKATDKELPNEVIELIVHCLQTDPFQRPQTAAWVKDKITGILRMYEKQETD